jgi:fatty acid desaturase
MSRLSFPQTGPLFTKQDRFPANRSRTRGELHATPEGARDGPTMTIFLSDPTYCAAQSPSSAERIAERFIRDRRDLPFLKLMGLLSITVVPTGVILFVPGAFRWSLAVVHLALVVYFMGPFVLMLHNTSHRTLFRRPWRWMNQYIPWVLGLFFGESPEAYFAHHLGMHHPENNLDDDVSSTLPYRRDSFVDFWRYFFRFLLGGLFEITQYFARKGRRSLMVRCVLGELSFLAGTVVLSVVLDWRATVVVFIIPLVLTRFAMMAGNWAQHAFIDEAEPHNNYRNSVTCINANYNRRCFNDGYHIGHHLKPSRHWTDMPEDFARNLENYAVERAIVFTGIDFFVVWLFLMFRRYDLLAERMVPLGGKLSLDERIHLLRTRTQWRRPRERCSR